MFNFSNIYHNNHTRHALDIHSRHLHHLHHHCGHHGDHTGRQLHRSEGRWHGRVHDERRLRRLNVPEVHTVRPEIMIIIIIIIIIIWLWVFKDGDDQNEDARMMMMKKMVPVLRLFCQIWWHHSRLHWIRCWGVWGFNSVSKQNMKYLLIEIERI